MEAASASDMGKRAVGTAFSELFSSVLRGVCKGSGFLWGNPKLRRDVEKADRISDRHCTAEERPVALVGRQKKGQSNAVRRPQNGNFLFKKE